MMADITMCLGKGCQVRETCYRYTAPVDQYMQSVYTETPKTRPCPHFWNNAGRVNGKVAGIWWKPDRRD